MATATPDQTRGSGTSGDCDLIDRRITAFCSPRFPELFHAFAYATDVWKQDPFDVKSIHVNARVKFQQVVSRVLESSGLAAGRVLLLLGESGCGKTHLMRAFRNQVHSQGKGYCAYLQMTAFTGHYGRYVLANLVESLDKAYDDSQSQNTGLMRLSIALAELCRAKSGTRLEQLREGDLDQGETDQLIGEMSDAVILDERFSAIDVYLVQAMLYLQCNDPRISARVLKYLRCEDLTDRDRRLLGGIVPCTYEDAPIWIIQRLGQLIWAVERVPLILCVDQLEDVFDLDQSAVKFRRAMATLCDIVSRLPSAIVVIACLENYYDELRKLLTKPVMDRVENDPPPVGLQSLCGRNEVENLIGHRLKFLYESLAAPYQAHQPTFPLPEAFVCELSGMRARDVLSRVQTYRESSVKKGKMAEFPFKQGDGERSDPEVDVTSLAQQWNELRSTFAPEVPVDDSELAAIIARIIPCCSEELELGRRFEPTLDGWMVRVDYHADGQPAGRMVVGLCNKRAQGGGLSRQIDEVVQKSAGRTPVIVRSTDFPSNPKAAVAGQIAELVSSGGRQVVVEDSDWRVMLASMSFRQQHGTEPAFLVWLKRTRPITSLKSVRRILNLDPRETPG
jgi:chloramphenicol 3-O-phosphotransferase